MHIFSLFSLAVIVILPISAAAMVVITFYAFTHTTVYKLLCGLNFRPC